MKPTKEAKTVFQKPKGFLVCKGSSIGVRPEREVIDSSGSALRHLSH